MADIAIFGGSFDPVHNAHIETALLALKEFNLKSVIFVPAYLPPHKVKLQASQTDRVNMLKLAIKNFNELSIDLFEVNSKKVIYTYQTLDYLQKQTTDKIKLLVGSDSYIKLGTWKNIDYIAQNFGFLTLQRGDIKIDSTGKYYPFTTVGKTVVENISSTKIKQMLKEKDINVTKYIPNDVFEYIRKHKLYGTENI
ncbi:nicotinate (nicotinamide) nucleotide adenylyltransferase [Candidatus Ruminimicrobium bovinum]|uniref:nicotinate (nicotinamide) nucleotide adenylyltransferase n=1 Tax=Candidatus Ruminimicrobium bovinum TaxID=3242779 RepID=UPI0039B8E9AE